MKHSGSIWHSVIIAGTLTWSVSVSAQGPQLFGFNEKDAQIITIKNTSGDSANDFHLKVKVPLPGMGGTPIIKKVVFVPGAAGQTGAFKDSVFAQPYPSSCDWGAAENNFMVPPGQAIRIQLWGNGYKKDSTYLTRNGIPLSTNGLKVRLEINKNGGGGGGGTMKMVNEDGSGILLQNLELHINNSNFPFDSVNYSPTGTLVPGIPASLMVNPGDSIVYSYSGNLPGNWITLHCWAARTSSPGDYFEMGAAANDIVLATIPTLSQWGLITLAILMLSIGLFYVKNKQS